MNAQINPQLSFGKVVDDFLSLLLDEGGMQEVSSEVRAQMLSDLRTRLNEKIFVSMLSRLDDQKVTEFRKISEAGGDAEKVEKFIDSNIPDAQDFFGQVMMSFREDYLGLK